MTGWCKLYVKDSSDMSEVEDESVQLIITVPSEVVALGEHDAPVDSAFPQYNNVRLLQSLSLFAFTSLSGIFRECYRVLKSDGIFMFNIGQPGHDWLKQFPNATPTNCLLPFLAACRILADANFKLQIVFIMVKTSGLQQKLQYIKCMNMLQRHEYWFMFSKSDCWKHNLTADHTISTVFSADLPKPADDVPTAWDEKAIEELIQIFSKEGDLLLDPMAGTGTLGKVAVALNRNCILYDNNEKLREIIKSKVGAVLIEEPKT